MTDNEKPAICDEQTTMFMSGPVFCVRPRLHGGDHAWIDPAVNEYGNIAVHVWRAGGGTGWVVSDRDEIVYCSTCAAPTPFGDADGLCIPCRCDAKWLAGYQAGTVFVANGRAMNRSTQSGAFGNAMLTVTLDDGRVFGPDSRTWDLGDVSALMRPDMPDNATLKWS